MACWCRRLRKHDLRHTRPPPEETGSRRGVTVDYLVEMTTTVPEGTTEEQVADMRRREAVNSERLAAEGSLLRLWRPPLQPGEWRTFGLFSAPDADALASVLATMPLRVWRHDVATPLAPHPNDPADTPPAPAPEVTEFFVTFTIAEPADTDRVAFDAANAGEADRARDDAAAGVLARLWKLPTDDGVTRVLGLWRDTDQDHLQAVLDDLPLTPWMRTAVLPLAPHPSDPARALSHGTSAQ
jgi:muconolactone delta-isomerase